MARRLRRPFRRWRGLHPSATQTRASTAPGTTRRRTGQRTSTTTARPPTAQRTYGYHRLEILAALANGAALVAISAIPSGLDAMSAHVVAGERPPHRWLDDVRATLRRRFGIDHVTIQVEGKGTASAGAADRMAVTIASTPGREDV